MSEERVSLAGLGYIGIHAPDPVGWRDFATGVCGLVPSRVVPGPRQGGIPIPAPDARGIAADGTAYLKMDRRQWRLAVHPAAESGLGSLGSLGYLGFELRNAADFDRAVETIAKRGVAIREGDASELEARSVERLAVLEDPAGHRLELFQSPIIDDDFDSPHDIEFLTGEFGMGHVVLYVPDIEAALAFYREVLDFERSDYMNFGPDGKGIHFMRCTRRHHSLALLHLGELSGLQHLMLEATSLDGVGKALDRALSSGIEITSGLGRHRNDKTVSFYMKGPSGFEVEIGWDGLVVDDDWVEHEFAGGGDDWGHHGLTAESLQPDDQDDQDD